MSAVPENDAASAAASSCWSAGPAQPELAHLPVETIHPNPRQPRKRFDHEATSALADSIRAQGLVQPVVVRPRKAGGFELIAGERRWRAAREAGHADGARARARGRRPRHAAPRARRERRSRAALRGRGGARLRAAAGRVRALARRALRADRQGEADRLEPPAAAGAARRRAGARGARRPDRGHARAVLAVPDHDGRRRLARQIVRRGMSVRAAERAARWAGAKTKPRKVPKVDPALPSGCARPPSGDGLSGADRLGPARDRLHRRDRARRAGRSARRIA